MTRRPSSFVSPVVLLLAFVVALSQAQLDGLTQEIRVSPGQNVVMTCNATNTDLTTVYRWKKPRDDRQYYGQVLMVPAVTRDDEGVYSCHATTVINGKTFEDVRSTSIVLNPAQGGGSEDVINIGGGAEEEPMIEFSPAAPNGIVERPVGAQVYQVCTVTSQPQDYRFHWIGPDGNRRISESHFFFFSNVNVEQSGEYTCVVTNVATGSEYRKSLRLVITAGNNGGGSSVTNFRVFISATPERPVIGSPLELRCETDPRLSGATFQWYLNNKLRSEGPVYVIPNPQKNDVMNAKYECRVLLNGIQQTAEQALTVSVHNSRELRLTPPPGPQIVVNLGDRKELHCEVERNSAGSLRGRDVQWFFQGQPLYPDRSRGIERMDRVMVSIITLTNIQQNHEGKYECRLNNIPKEAYIIVMSGEISSLEVNPPEYRANEGEVVEFHCRANNIPGVKNTDLEWYFLGEDRNGVERPLRPEWTVSNSPNTIETSFIMIEPVLPRDRGYYLCRVSSRLNVDVEPAIGFLEINTRPSVTVNVRVYPKIVQVRVNTDATVSCDVTVNNRPEGLPSWRFTNGASILTDPRFIAYPTGQGRSELRFSRLSVRDNGTRIECFYENYQDEVIIIVEGNICGPNTFYCNSGTQCFDRSKRCDGQRDCLDGSDEDPAYCKPCDPLDSLCESYNGRAPLKRTYSPSWQCDGEDDCGNGYDEANCRKFGNVCGGTTFECSDGVSIPRAYMCDKESDCRNGEDENSCSGPTILPSFNENRVQRVRVGDTIMLTCQATGKPMPKVIWRFNWRCLPDTSRVTVSTTELGCEKVESKLTIINVRPEDDGIYNCEALAANQRSISDDYQVTVYTNQ